MLPACFFSPELSHNGKVICAYLTHILHDMLSTLHGLLYSALTAAVTTEDQQELGGRAPRGREDARPPAMSLITFY